MFGILLDRTVEYRPSLGGSAACAFFHKEWNFSGCQIVATKTVAAACDEFFTSVGVKVTDGEQSQPYAS